MGKKPSKRSFPLYCHPTITFVLPLHPCGHQYVLEIILDSHTVFSIAYCRSQRYIAYLSHTGCGYPHRDQPHWLLPVFHTLLPVNLLGARSRCPQPDIMVLHTALVLPLTKPKARRRVDHNVFSTSGLIVQLCSTLLG